MPPVRGSTLARTVVAFGPVLAALASADAARAQNVALQWNFNDDTVSVTSPPPSINLTNGIPAASLLGGVTASFAAGSPLDPATPNTAWNTTAYPAQGAASGTAGVRFNTPTTSAAGGFDNIVIRFDQRNSGTASRFFELQYTLNGTDWVTSRVYPTTLNDTFFTRTLDLSQIPGAANNPNLAFRTRSVFAPGTSQYAATTGTDTYGTTGTVRFDLVTVSRGVRWTGGTGTDIGAAANWQGGTTPGSGDTVLFGASANTTVNVPAARTLGQVVFRSDAPAYTFSGTSTLTASVGLVNNSTATQTFTAPFALSGQRTIENNGTLVFNNLTAAGNTRTLLLGTGRTAINGTYTGNDIDLTGGHTLGGVGTLLNEVQTYTAKIRGGFNDGTNNFGTLTINGGGAGIDLELYPAPGDAAPTILVQAGRTGPGTVQNSRIALVGGSGTDLELNGAGQGSNTFKVEVIGPNLVLGETYTMTILTTDSTGSIEFDNNPSPDGFVFPATSYQIVSSDFASVTNAELRVADVGGGSTLVLTFTPVPEPATVLGIAVAALGGTAAVRRRFAKAPAA